MRRAECAAIFLSVAFGGCLPVCTSYSASQWREAVEGAVIAPRGSEAVGHQPRTGELLFEGAFTPSTVAGAPTVSRIEGATGHRMSSFGARLRFAAGLSDWAELGLVGDMSSTRAHSDLATDLASEDPFSAVASRWLLTLRLKRAITPWFELFFTGEIGAASVPLRREGYEQRQQIFNDGTPTQHTRFEYVTAYSHAGFHGLAGAGVRFLPRPSIGLEAGVAGGLTPMVVGGQAGSSFSDCYYGRYDASTPMRTTPTFSLWSAISLRFGPLLVIGRVFANPIYAPAKDTGLVLGGDVGLGFFLDTEPTRATSRYSAPRSTR